MARGISSARRLGGPWPTLLLALVTLSVPLHEFLALQRMSDQAVRERFELPQECDPRLTATADPPGRILVVVSCVGPDPEGGAEPHR